MGVLQRLKRALCEASIYRHGESLKDTIRRLKTMYIGSIEVAPLKVLQQYGIEGWEFKGVEDVLDARSKYSLEPFTVVLPLQAVGAKKVGDVVPYQGKQYVIAIRALESGGKTPIIGIQSERDIEANR